MAESRHIERHDSAHRTDRTPDPSIRPEGLWPRRQHEDDRVGVHLRVRVPDPCSIADPEVGSDFRSRLISHRSPPLGTGGANDADLAPFPPGPTLLAAGNFWHHM